MEKPYEFMTRTYGEKYDIDGHFGAQCWDYFAYLCIQCGYKIVNCTNSGYVKDIWNQRNKNGVLNNFVVVSKNAMQQGDVVVMKECDMCPYSHIGLFNEYKKGNDSFILMAQNQYGESKVTNGVFNIKDILGVLRPKCWANQGKINIPNSGTLTAKYDYIRVRTSPKIDEKNLTGDWYNKGMKLNYQALKLSDGWWWLVYKAVDKKLHYIAYATEDLRTVYWK